MNTDEGLDIFRWAAETNNVSEIVPAFVGWLMELPTLERVHQLRERMSDEGMGVIARAVAEELLGTSATGEHDFQHFPARLGILPEPFLQALFGEQGYQRLKDIALTSTVIVPTTDARRQVQLHASELAWRLLLRRCMHWLGGCRN